LTRTPKTQSFNYQFFFVAILVIPLLGFFFYATYVETSFFGFIAAGSLLSLAYLVPLRQKLSSHLARVQIQVQDINERINLVEAEIKREVKAIDSFEGKIVDSSQLKGLTEKLSMCLTLEDTTGTLSSEISKMFGSEDTTMILYLFHSRTGELGIMASQKGQMRVNIKLKKGDEFDQWVIKTMQPLLIEDARSDYRFDPDKIMTEDSRSIRSLISVPFTSGNKVLGILRVDSPRPHYFAMEDLRFLTTIGDLGAVAIENAQLYEHVQELAIRDGLTDLYLRRYLMERLPEELIRHARNRHELSFIMLDLDRFKQYNDKYGHMAGDIVVRTLALILKGHFVNPGDLICRYGGEEFCVLLPDCPGKRAVELAEDFRKKVEGQDIILRRNKTRVTVSIGVAVFPKDAADKDGLILAADKALYQAKSKGRNCVVAAGPLPPARRTGKEGAR
jgi:diguanylate cyclase (GGDEF)-like protein